MDYQVAWSPEAIADVESIASYIARDSRFYAAVIHGKRMLNPVTDRITGR